MNKNISNPLVSIIIPVYNGEKYIAETIQSVIDQTYENWELIIVDDGSTDNTSNIVKKFNDTRIIYIKKNNTGVSDTRNIGAKMSKGNFLCFLDADDVWLSKNLEIKVKKLLDEPDCVLVSSAFYLWDERDDYINCKINDYVPNDDWEDLRKLRSISLPSSALISSKFFFEANMFDTNLSTSADFDLWIRMRALGHFNFISEPLVKYRSHSNQMHRNIKLYEHDMIYILKKYKDCKKIFPTRNSWKKSMSLLHYYLAVEYVRQKQINNFFVHSTKSIFFNPSLIFYKMIKKI
ncbi:MAG: glycosyltransferase [Bacteroidales bacterium]|jgi:glycosyltransferase involved in cell wall biosynthesis|nr:glycosyltransferase [Bacteroidales bacterium]MDI9575467.1 glycosyltransferase [Bacteroidota bacterium]MDD3755087.1 glycosyltransferase [Bacteroidales bacterium]MDY0400442.1 glycosyltransferase [Bacteroidales bacterium]HHW59923.1 glycosyltransferase [Bacteroidales bacterium]